LKEKKKQYGERKHHAFSRTPGGKKKRGGSSRKKARGWRTKIVGEKKKGKPKGEGHLLRNLPAGIEGSLP